MGVIAIPNRSLPPEPAALSAADKVLASLDRLTAEEVEQLTDHA
jgi:hypothetical protein